MHLPRLLAPVVALAALLPLAAACGGGEAADPGPPCAQVVDHMLAVTRQQMAAHGEMQLADKRAMIATCEKRGYTGAQRRCLATAKDLTAIAGCVPRPTRPGAAGGASAGSAAP